MVSSATTKQLNVGSFDSFYEPVKCGSFFSVSEAWAKLVSSLARIKWTKQDYFPTQNGELIGTRILGNGWWKRPTPPPPWTKISTPKTSICRILHGDGGQQILHIKKTAKFVGLSFLWPGWPKNDQKFFRLFMWKGRLNLWAKYSESQITIFVSRSYKSLKLEPYFP